ncbi:hypothetical protein H0H87_008708 [Tephrocybe sp. NHM501043]|nr:hypothetical protein H0H87_008708 [Tephrocybe sp. NHM501043]
MPTNVTLGGTTSPSTVLVESLAIFSKSAHQAFAEVENEARQEVARANSDAREARLERDKVLNALHAFQLDEQVLHKEIADLKATVSHLKETMTQLRREAAQWKDQSRNWQEHFTRVEQERCGLTTRIEELVAEQIQWNRSLPTPFTHNHPDPDEVESAPLHKPRHTPTSSRKHPVSPPDVDPPSTSTSGHKPNRIASKSIKLKYNEPTPSHFPSRDSQISNQNNITQTYGKRKSSPESLSQPPPRTTVIRRVRAVIDVKQEPSDEEPENLDTEQTDVASSTRRGTPRKRETIHHNEDYGSGDESDQAPLASDQSYEYDNDDDDDELMLGGEVSGCFSDCHPISSHS